MSNIRDGGSIIIGIEKQDRVNGYAAKGMSATIADSYDHDEVLEFANSYAMPYVIAYLKHYENGGLRYVVIDVREFDSTPVLCKKDYPKILEKGRLYTRPFAKAESSGVLTSAELEEVIEMILEKRLKKDARLRQLVFGGQPSPTGDDDSKFREDR